MEKNIEQLVASRNSLAAQQRELFIETVEKINIANRELLKNDLGITFAKNVSRDLAGEIIRRYFDLGDYYITVDQMAYRILNFRYDHDPDFLMNNDNIKKTIYNATDAKTSKAMESIVENCKSFQTQLFTEERSKDKFDINGKRDYRISRVENIHEEKGVLTGTLRDELSGREVQTTTKPQNKKDWYSRDLQADHKIPREAITYNKRYIKDSQEILDKYKAFYNSDANMQMMLASANSSKGDVRVCNVNGEIKYMNPKSSEYKPEMDITMSATPDQLVEAAVHQWENAGASAKENMRKGGYLDENGKVKQEVKDAYKKQIEELMNERDQSLGDLADFKYGNIAIDASKTLPQALGKIVIGQLIYYVMPPIIFETQQILRKKNMTIKRFFRELEKSGKRVINYVKSKLSDILLNIAGNTLNKFIKVFFDTIIEMAKATVKRLVKIIKDVLLSFISCCKTVINPNISVDQKADSITKILFTTINAIVLEIIFEYLEKQFALPDILMEPLQIIVTIISTNLIMLILDELDLFDVRYGLLTNNIDKVFREENERFMAESLEILSKGYEINEFEENSIKKNIINILESIKTLDISEDDVTESLEQINNIFSMGIDFEAEWQYFTKRSELSIS